METCITICKKDSQWEMAIGLRELRQRLCINLEEWDGEGYTYIYGLFMLMFDRKQQNSVKQVSFSLKSK